MANFKFEGDIDGINKRQLEFVSSVLEDRGFKNERVLVSVVGKVDDNYGSNVKRFVVEKNGTTFKMVAKIALSDVPSSMRTTMKLVFENEHIMYTRVLPKLSELEKGADIHEDERLKYAKCYGSLSEESNEIILLEDLQVSNFAILDKYKSMTDETVKLVLKNFARLHSLSYALKKQEPETYEEFKGALKSMWMVAQEIEEYQAYYANIENEVMALLDNDKLKKAAKGILSQGRQHARKISKIYKDSKYSVIQQGDSWTNNILFRLEDGKTVECCMIDYQLSVNNSPVADLEYMIFNCTDYETRSKHYHEWIDYYHEQLDRCLGNFGLKANLVYPRDQLDVDLRLFGKFSLGLSIMLAHMLQREMHEAANMKEAMRSENNIEGLINVSNLSKLDKSSQIRIKTRVEGLINSFLELGYL